MAFFAKKPALPDAFGRRLTWSEWLAKYGSPWNLRQLPGKSASESRTSDRPRKDMTRLNLDR